MNMLRIFACIAPCPLAGSLKAMRYSSGTTRFSFSFHAFQTFRSLTSVYLITLPVFAYSTRTSARCARSSRAMYFLYRKEPHATHIKRELCYTRALLPVSLVPVSRFCKRTKSSAIETIDQQPPSFEARKPRRALTPCSDRPNGRIECFGPD